MFAALLAIAITLVSFESYIASTGRDIVTWWIHTEFTNIQEGQLLSTISKQTRATIKSEFLRGIWIVDSPANSKIKPRILIDFGTIYSLDASKLPQQTGTVTLIHVGIFKYVGLYRLGNQPDIVIGM